MKRDLPKYCYTRDDSPFVWARFKNETGTWVNKKTPYTAKPEDDENLRRFMRALLRGIERKTERGTPHPTTIADYASDWLAERDRRELACAGDDRRHLEKYAMPIIGRIELEQLRPRHVRDMVRQLRQVTYKVNDPRLGREVERKLAPRTIHHIFNTVHVLMESAIVEELYFGENPVKVKSGELPKKVDADAEWRSQATYTTKEVVMLISSPIIPVERRVQYALKALAGMRHGEMAAFRWRNRDSMHEPLAKLNISYAWCSREKLVKSTKTEDTREVPEHPALKKILDDWRAHHWARIYGTEPKEDDFIVPARTGRCVDGHEANRALKRDLAALGLRVRAGSRRDRGGHDLRGWYETQPVEDGADSMLIRRTTHAAPTDVVSGYHRFSWQAFCREVAKLVVPLPENPLELVTESLRLEKRAGARWTKIVTPKGLEAVCTPTKDVLEAGPIDERAVNERARARTSEHSTGTPSLRRRRKLIAMGATLGAMLERAALEGDLPRILEIARSVAADD